MKNVALGRSDLAGDSSDDPAIRAMRAEVRREWSLLNDAEVLVIALNRSDIGYVIQAESVLGNRARGEGVSIADALRAVRDALGLAEEHGRLVHRGTAAA